MNDMNALYVSSICSHGLYCSVLYSTVPTAAAAAPLLYRACNLCQACTRTHSSDSTATTQQHKDVKVSQSVSQPVSASIPPHPILPYQPETAALPPCPSQRLHVLTPSDR